MKQSACQMMDETRLSASEDLFSIMNSFFYLVLSEMDAESVKIVNIEEQRLKEGGEDG